MSEIAIHVEGLSKRYRIGAAQERYVALRDVISRQARRLGRRIFRRAAVQSAPFEDFWALQDVSFDVKRGECVGIIGRNGAGKSTLLKLLSRITEPTEGRFRCRGRIASLLEVGTGFHPELTGRENIFLNGAILGMSRKETTRKFDEIVAFSEVEKFLDTPVKYYSSGMYTRLAFSVAAHLEPEILVIDEVLAVGDVAFQKKCLGKMESVAQQGRTVLFVSHNMQAINQLTTSAVLLQKGRVLFQGDTPTAVARYTEGVFSDDIIGRPYIGSHSRHPAHVARASVQTSEGAGEHLCEQPISLEFLIDVNEPRDELCLSVHICNEVGVPVCHFWLEDRSAELNQGVGRYRAVCSIPKLRLYQGRYTITTSLANRRGGGELIEKLTEICPFEVSMGALSKPQFPWHVGEMTYKEDFEWSPLIFESTQQP